MRFDPALARLHLAVLFFLTILGQDEFGFQGNDVRIVGLDYDWGQHAVKIARLAIAQDPMVTLLAVDLLRTEVFSPIDGHQELFAKGTIPFQQSGLFHFRKNIADTCSASILRRHGIEQITDLVITG